MIPLAIWLVLIGYTITWTGKMNLGLTYQPQTDGTIKPVGPDGKDASLYSLMDAITCAEPSGVPESVNTPTTKGTTPPPMSTRVLPNPVPALQRIPWLQPVPIPRPNPFGGIRNPLPTPKPRPIGMVDSLSQWVHRWLQPIVVGGKTLVHP